MIDRRICTMACIAILLEKSSFAESYRLPWAPDTRMDLTQDCDVRDYADHVASNRFAWDFANGSEFAILAARGGVVTHLKMSSQSGCAVSKCVDEANYAVVDHNDGTASVYLHLAPDSLDPAVVCGSAIAQGQPIARAGSTGWTTGNHLHFQVNRVRPNPSRLCECGPDGKNCPASYALWSAFWSSRSFPSQPIAFDEWPATPCANRRQQLPMSRNLNPFDLTTPSSITARVEPDPRPLPLPVALFPPVSSLTHEPRPPSKRPQAFLHFPPRRRSTFFGTRESRVLVH